ncbi:MAG: hypothetical protein DMG61_08555 [Acidobacteria bacterium]|nr:MAG: hypothetical protein DMG61_08555 [Acidobacteriota bacterium]
MGSNAKRAMLAGRAGAGVRVGGFRDAGSGKENHAKPNEPGSRTVHRRSITLSAHGVSIHTTAVVAKFRDSWRSTRVDHSCTIISIRTVLRWRLIWYGVISASKLPLDNSPLHLP